jgi:hypothetical protein
MCLLIDFGEIEEQLLVLGLDLGADGFRFVAEESVVAYLSRHEGLP